MPIQFSLAAEDAQFSDRIQSGDFGSLPAELKDRCGSLLDKIDPDAEGYFVHVLVGVVLTKPLRITVKGSEGATQVLVVIEEEARVMIVEELRADIQGSWSHACEVFVADNAEVTYTSIQLTGATQQCFIQQRSQLGAGAKIHWQNSTLGGHDVTQDLRSHIIGDNAQSSVDWMFYAKGDERQNLFACNIFDAREGRGEILMKGVAQEQAHVACEGLIDIGLKGGGTDTYLTEDVLMLDKTAKVDAIPGLEIKTNDVKASHSATVSRVTPEDVFYFVSRGIPEHEARAMYVLGFLSSLTEKMVAEERGAVVGAVERKYRAVGGGGRIRDTFPPQRGVK